MAAAKTALRPRSLCPKNSGVARTAEADEQTGDSLLPVSSRVVPVGASAGGLATFVVALIQHPEPRHKRAFTTHLSIVTSIPTIEVSGRLARIRARGYTKFRMKAASFTKMAYRVWMSMAVRLEVERMSLLSARAEMGVADQDAIA